MALLAFQGLRISSLGWTVRRHGVGNERYALSHGATVVSVAPVKLPSVVLHWACPLQLAAHDPPRSLTPPGCTLGFPMVPPASLPNQC